MHGENIVDLRARGRWLVVIFGTRIDSINSRNATANTVFPICPEHTMETENAKISSIATFYSVLHASELCKTRGDEFANQTKNHQNDPSSWRGSQMINQSVCSDDRHCRYREQRYRIPDRETRSWEGFADQMRSNWDRTGIENGIYFSIYRTIKGIFVNGWLIGRWKISNLLAPLHHAPKVFAEHFLKNTLLCPTATIPEWTIIITQNPSSYG